MPQQPPHVDKATLTALPNGKPLTVHFNPASLVYSVENSVAQQSGGPKKKQYVAQFSGKLTMDLQFDTTDTGSDVRTVTNQVALFMQASGNASAAAQNAAPPSADGNSSGPRLRLRRCCCFNGEPISFRESWTPSRRPSTFFPPMVLPFARWSASACRARIRSSMRARISPAPPMPAASCQARAATARSPWPRAAATRALPASLARTTAWRACASPAELPCKSAAACSSIRPPHL